MVSIRLASATAVLLALAGCTASATAIADCAASADVSIGAPDQNREVLSSRTGCSTYSFPDGGCAYKVIGCKDRAIVCVTPPSVKSRPICELGNTTAEAMARVKAHKVECFPCHESYVTEGDCTYTINACQYRASVCVDSKTGRVCEHADAACVAMENVWKHDIQC